MLKLNITLENMGEDIKLLTKSQKMLIEKKHF